MPADINFLLHTRTHSSLPFFWFPRLHTHTYILLYTFSAPLQILWTLFFSLLPSSSSSSSIHFLPLSLSGKVIYARLYFCLRLPGSQRSERSAFPSSIPSSYFLVWGREGGLAPLTSLRATNWWKIEQVCGEEEEEEEEEEEAFRTVLCCTAYVGGAFRENLFWREKGGISSSIRFFCLSDDDAVRRWKVPFECEAAWLRQKRWWWWYERRRRRWGELEKWRQEVMWKSMTFFS